MEFLCQRPLLLALLALACSGWLNAARALDAPIDTTKPIDVSAAQLSYDQNARALTASGAVEASQDGNELRADRLVYQQDTRRLFAEGNVVFKDATGQTLTTQRLELTDDFKDGVIQALELRFVDNARLRAGGGVRENGTVSRLESAGYTPCKTCKDNSFPPLWEITAGSVTHNATDKTITYKGATLNVLDTPVFYAPYFQHPDPTVKRQSGFLAPKLGRNSEQGLILGTPYFWSIDDSQDLTLEPRYFSSAGEMLLGDYRRQFGNGKLDISASGASVDELKSGSQTNRTVTAGNIKARGAFDINDAWRWSFLGNRASDKFYLRRFDFPEGDVLTSNLTAERLEGDSYFNASSYAFQTLRPAERQENSPLLAPWLRYNTILRSNQMPGQFTVDASTLSLSRRAGVDSRRLSLGGGWDDKKTTDTGVVFRYGGLVRADTYQINDNFDSSVSRNRDGNVSRAVPFIFAEARQPWLRQTQTGLIHIIEPRIGVVASPNGGNPDQLPNEDARSFNFDTSNLFTPDRVYGYDRVDTGQRLDVGVSNNFSGIYGATLNTFIGQSFRTKDSDVFGAGSGLEHETSDYVGRISIARLPFVDFDSKIRVAKSDAKIQSNDTTLTTTLADIQFSTDYLFFGDASSPSGKSLEELGLNLSSFVMPKWLLEGRFVRDIAAPDNRFAGVGLTYYDQCIALGLDVDRDFTNDGTNPSSTTVMLRVDFRNLGGDAWDKQVRQRNRLGARRFNSYEREQLGYSQDAAR